MCGRSCDYPHGEYLCDSTDSNGCAPCKQLSELEEKVRQIRLTLAGLEIDRQKLKEQVNQHHDRLIHRLPPELVSEIFELCVPGDLLGCDLARISSRYTICTPLVLSDVCRRWRDIAHSTPRLWKMLPMFFRASDPRSLPVPLLVKEWIKRAGQLPLTIIFYATSDESTMDAAIQIIAILNQFSNRWLHLRYNGPASLLPYFKADDEDLRQLRTLYLQPGTSSLTFREETINLHPSRLNELWVIGIRLATVKFDYHHLVRLALASFTLSECFHVLGNAPNIRICCLLYEREPDEEDHELPLPPTPIACTSIRQLKVTIPLHEKVFEHLLCPVLEYLRIVGDSQLVELPLIIGFLKRSGCSLERLVLENVQLSMTDIALLAEAIPTLQRLELKLHHSEPALRILLEYLAEFSTSDGIQIPRCLPALRWLSFEQHPFHDWRMVPDIFGTTIANPTDRHRRMLKYITISTSLASRGSSSRRSSDLVRGVIINSETLARSLWLKEEGVNWTISQAEIEWT